MDGQNDGMTADTSQSCRHENPFTGRCRLPVDADGLCQWHDPARRKQGDDDRAALSELAQGDVPLTGISLDHAQLPGLNLALRDNHRADLRGADLHRANLSGAHLFGTDLRGANLLKCDLSDANLNSAQLEDANLLGAKLEGAKLEHVAWGARVQQERQAAATKNPQQAVALRAEAEEVYRMLRRESERRGLFQDAGLFFQKEMRMRRKQKPLWSFSRAISKLVDLTCGYGESPMRVILFSMTMIIGCAAGYLVLGVQDGNELIRMDAGSGLLNNFLQCLYFSVVTFTTLGYGDIVPVGASRLLASFEAFAGAFTIALFVVVFMKKMTR